MALAVRLMGAVTLVRDGRTVDIGGPKQQLLLAVLALSAGRRVSTDRLIDSLWGEDPPATARRTVQSYVASLRRGFGSDAPLRPSQNGYTLDIDRSDVDLLAFEDEVTGLLAAGDESPDDTARALSSALATWDTPLGSVRDTPRLEQLTAPFEELHLQALEALAAAQIAGTRAGDAVRTLEALVREHPTRENLWLQLAHGLARIGRRDMALNAIQRAREALRDQLGVHPSALLTDFEAELLAGPTEPTTDDEPVHAAGHIEPSHEPQRLERRLAGTDETPTPPMPRAVPAAHVDALDIEPGSALRPAEALAISRDPRTMRRALPAERTSFVGRVQELSRAAELLETARLLTLTGPPGSGKTRLALKLAARSQDEFPHGTHFVPLAPIADHRLMIETIAATLDLRAGPGESPIDCVKRFLRDRSTLLVLDNFEHILPAAPLVGELLDEAPELHVVVTSRTPLAIAGEQVFPVPPLAVPPDHVGSAAAAGYDAISLFEARARAADPDFVLDAGNTAAVVRIVASVEGLPLAIELAAARVRSLSPEQLAGRLAQRLAVLTGGPTDVERRHRTMRDAIAWSLELQSPEHRALFRRLGVFRGGFTLEAVGAVAECTDIEVLDGVDALVSDSLLHRQISSPRDRLGMLEMVREFALEMLVEAGERDQVAEHHARYYAHLVADVSPSLTRDPKGEGAQQLEAEVDNIRAAIRFALEVPSPDLGLQLGADLWQFWHGSLRMTEGRAWLEQLLALPGGSTERRAGGLTALAGLAYWQADYGTAMARYADALELYRALGDQLGATHTVFAMSLTATWGDDLEAGQRLADEASAAFERIGSPEGLALAVLARGFVRLRRGDYRRAYDDYRTGLVAAREQGDQHFAVTLLPGVAASAFHLGRKDEALDLAIEGANEAAGLHNTNLAVWMLDLIATIVADTEPAAAVNLAGAAACLRDAAGGGMRIESLNLRNAREIAAGLVSSDQLTDSWSAGHRMTLEQALDLALIVRARLAPG